MRVQSRWTDIFDATARFMYIAIWICTALKCDFPLIYIYIYVPWYFVSLMIAQS
jgi:hypothetical protein